MFGLKFAYINWNKKVWCKLKFDKNKLPKTWVMFGYFFCSKVCSYNEFCLDNTNQKYFYFKRNKYILR